MEFYYEVRFLMFNFIVDTKMTFFNTKKHKNRDLLVERSE